MRKAMPNLPEYVKVRDVTIREADDQAGTTFSVEKKVQLVKKLVEMGVTEVEPGGVSLVREQYETCKALKDSKIQVNKTARFFGTSKDFKKDIDKCVEAGADNIRVTLIHITDESLLKQAENLPDIAKYAHNEYNIPIWFMSDDTVRTNFELIRKIYTIGVDAGFDRAGLTDTHGVASPPAIRYLASEIRKIIGDLPLAAHTHNDFGLATANALAAVEGGATEVDLTINGLGDRGGNAPFEEVVASLELLYGIKTGIKLEKIYEVSKLVEELSGVRLQPHKAIVGENAFLQEASWQGMYPPPDLYDESGELPINPSVFGRSLTFAWGPVGTVEDKPIKMKLDAAGFKYTDSDVQEIKRKIEQMVEEKAVSERRRGYITDQELEDIARQILKK